MEKKRPTPPWKSVMDIIEKKMIERDTHPLRKKLHMKQIQVKIQEEPHLKNGSTDVQNAYRELALWNIWCKYM
jgi:hypothetical protein